MKKLLKAPVREQLSTLFSTLMLVLFVLILPWQVSIAMIGGVLTVYALAAVGDW